MTGLNPQINLNLRFRIADTLGSVTTGATGMYMYDAYAPTVILSGPANTSIVYSNIVTLVRSAAIDT